MSLTDPVFDDDTIQQLSDTPNATEGLTPAQLKAKFDKGVADIKTYLGSLIDELENSTSGAEGAASIGVTYKSLPSTVQSALDTVTTDIEANVDTVQGNVDTVQGNVDAVQSNVDSLTSADISYDNSVSNIPNAPSTAQQAIEEVAVLTGVDGLQALIDNSLKRIAWGGAPY